MAAADSESRRISSLPLDSQLDQAAALNAVYEALTQSLDLSSLLQTALDEILRVTGFRIGGIATWDEAADLFRLCVHHGFTEEMVQRFELPRSAGGVRWVAADTGEPLFWQAGAPLPDEPYTALREAGFLTAALLPLNIPGQRLGMLVLLSKVSCLLSPNEREFLFRISQLLSVAMRNATLYAEMARLHRSLERQVDHLAALHEVSLDVASQLDQDILLDTICGHATRLLNVTGAMVYMVRPEGDALETVICHNLDRRYLGLRIKLSEGLAGQVAASGRPMAVEDYSRWEGRSPQYLSGTFFGFVGVPLIWRGQVLGVLTAADTQRPRRFTPEDIQLLTLFAQQAAVAIQNARVYHAEQNRRRLAETLRDAMAALGSHLVLGDVLDLVLEQLGRVITYRSASVALVDSQGWLRISAARGFEDPRVLDHAAWPLAEDPKAQTMVSSRRPLIIEDTRQNGQWFDVPGVDHIRSWIGAPLMIGDRLIGILNVDYDQPDFYRLEDAEVAGIFAGQVVAAVENARLYAEAQRRIQELRGLNEVARAFSATMNLRETTRAVTERVAYVLGAEICVILLLTQNQHLTALAPAYGLTDEDVARLHFPVGSEPRLELIGSEHCLVNDLAELSPEMRSLFASMGMRSLAGAAMRSRGQASGALLAANKASGFASDDAAWLAAIATQAAIVLENARLYEDTARLKTHYQNIIDSTGATIYTVDQTLRLTSFSAEWDRAAMRYGLPELTHTRLLGQSLLDSLDSPARARWGAVCATILDGGQFEDGGPTYREEMDIEQGNGRRTCYLTAGPLKDQDGNIAGIIFVSQDMTAQKDAERTAMQRARELSALYAVSTAVSQSLDLASALDHALPVVTSAFEVDSVQAFILESDTLGLADSRLPMAAADALEWRLVAHDGPLAQAILPHIVRLPLAVAQVVESGKPVVIPDVSQADAEVKSALADWEMPTQAFIPLHARGRTVGLLRLGWRQPCSPAERDLPLWLAIGRQIGVAIVNAQLYAASESRESEARAMYEVTRHLTSLDMYHLPENVLPRLRNLVDYDIAGLLVSQGTVRMLVHIANPVSDAVVKQFEQHMVGEYRALGLSETSDGELRQLERMTWGVPPGTQVSDEEIVSFLVAPLSVGARLAGMVVLGSKRANVYNEAKQRTLLTLANQIAVAVENAGLYETLRERARVLEHAYAELQEADRLKDELVQNVSHELRTPLTFIKGYVQLILSGDLGELTQKQREGLDVVARKTDMLSRLVEDIVTLERVDRENLHAQPMSLAELANLALDACTPTANSMQVTLIRDLPPALPLAWGDRDQIGEVFDNLLSNALKFTSAGGSITVRARDEGEFIRVEVSDTGTGIPHDKLDKIFERFYQVDGTSRRRFGGTGLGLAIVKRIIEMHSGTIGVTSQLGRGSTFYFTLPQAPKAPVE